jgi:signal transduction histidine kinase
MKTSGVKPYHFLGGALVIASFTLLFSLGYFALTSPRLPFRYNVFQIDQVIDRPHSGALEKGDILVTFDQKLLAGCWYFVNSPIYFAPRNTPVQVEYWRPAPAPEGGIVPLPSLIFQYIEQRPTGLGRAVTEVTLSDPSLETLGNWFPVYLLILTFALFGTILLLGGPARIENWLLGVAFFSHGVMLAAGTAMGHAQAPLSLFVWIAGLPLWGTLQMVTHALWPVRQIDRPVVRILIAIVAVNGVFHFLSVLAGAAGWGCYQTSWPVITGAVTYLLGLSLPVVFGAWLLYSAYRRTGNPFSRLQVRAIAWSIALAGIPILSFTIPTALGLPRLAPFDITLLSTALVPLTYFYAIYRGNLLSVDRYLHRLVYVFFFAAFWVVVTALVVQSISQWIDPPPLILVAVVAALPPLLLSTFIRDRLGMLVDLALYGLYYDYEAVVSQIGLALAGALNEETLAEVATRQLPQALSIRYAALWIMEGDDVLRLAGHSARAVDTDRAGPLRQPLRAFPPGQVGQVVELFPHPIHLGADSGEWQAVVRLYNGNRLAGLVLVGPKIQKTSYSERDVRTLRTLADWMATTVSNIRHLNDQREALARERSLMSALVENEERVRAEVAGELHDRGISALGVARLMVAQARSPEVVSATLERVIGDLRELSFNRLSPAGLEQGLSQALKEMVERQRALGLPISLHIEGPGLESAAPAGVQRELFYVAQEAVINAHKHACAGQIAITLTQAHNRLTLVVRDNGSGFDAGALRSGRDRRGLGIMEARANRVGAALSIASAAGQGSEVTVAVALSGEAEPEC